MIEAIGLAGLIGTSAGAIAAVVLALRLVALTARAERTAAELEIAKAAHETTSAALAAEKVRADALEDAIDADDLGPVGARERVLARWAAASRARGGAGAVLAPPAADAAGPGDGLLPPGG